VAKGWVTNLQETDHEAVRLYGKKYFSMRYEDLLKNPFKEMSRLWKFLGVKPINK